MPNLPAVGVFVLGVLTVQVLILSLNLLYWRRRRLGVVEPDFALTFPNHSSANLAPPSPLSASDPTCHSERSEESRNNLTPLSPLSASREGGEPSSPSPFTERGQGGEVKPAASGEGAWVRVTENLTLLPPSPEKRGGSADGSPSPFSGEKGQGVEGFSQIALSLLIPARNERENLPRLIESLAPQLARPDVELWVCDDGSDDGTTEWLAQNAERLGVRWFRSAPRPDGWVGKNWACYQLATRACGEWLVFLDADLVACEDFLPALLRSLSHSDAQLVSAIPTFTPSSIWVGFVKLLVPFSVFSLLPLALAENHPHRAFAFANGQLIGFRRCDYARWLPHFFVRSAVLEDVALAQLVKTHRGKVTLYDARPYLQVSMYRNYADASQGFAKNAVAICRNVPMTLLVAGLLVLVYGYPIGALLLSGGQAVWAWLAATLSVAIFGMSARVVGMRFGWGLLYLLSIAVGLTVLIRSVWWYTRGTVIWKGRVYRVRSNE